MNRVLQSVCVAIILLSGREALAAGDQTTSNPQVVVGPRAKAGDFDGDGRSDMTLYQPAGAWKILTSSSTFTSSVTANYGGAGYVPVPGDYDGDGKVDPAVYNSASGQWTALLSRWDRS
jgi:hypothetical protein